MWKGVEPSDTDAVFLVESVASESQDENLDHEKGPDPFKSEGVLPVKENVVPVQVFRNAGASITVVALDAVPRKTEAVKWRQVVIFGMYGNPMICPLFNVHLSTREFTGRALVVVCEHLPISGVQMVLGNDTAGTTGTVSPVDSADPVNQNVNGENCGMHPCCTVTLSQKKTEEKEEEKDLAEKLVDSLDRQNEESGPNEDGHSGTRPTEKLKESSQSQGLQKINETIPV